MTDCKGRGYCIEQCFGRGHKNHLKEISGRKEYDYCKTICHHNCQLVECHNFRMCGQRRPQWVLDANNGMCIDCAVHYGKIKFLDVKADCPICLEHKDVILISCGNHTVCIACWKTWCDSVTQAPVTCHLCRTPIWK